MTGKTAHEEESVSPPLKFTVLECKVIAGRQVDKGHPSVAQKSQGLALWSQAKYMV